MIILKLFFLSFCTSFIGGSVAEAQSLSNGGGACERIEKYTTDVGLFFFHENAMHILIYSDI
jgi:hypothetical protein